MSSRKSSSVWLHFSEVDVNSNAKCFYCHKSVAVSRNSTGNLIRHIRTHHPDVSIRKAYDIPANKEREQTSSVKIRLRKNSSSLWLHFSKVDDLRAKCVHCQQCVAVSRNSTGNLIRHMKRYHPEMSISKRQEENKLNKKLLDEEELICTDVTKLSDMQSINETPCKRLSEAPPCKELTTSSTCLSRSELPLKDERPTFFSTVSMNSKKSSVWLHFSEIDECSKAQCNYCNKLVAVSRNSTGNLIRHLKKHPEVITQQAVVIKSQTLPTEEEPTSYTIIDVDSRKKRKMRAHFSKVNRNSRSKCIHCGQIVGVSKNSTKNLIRHLKKHPDKDYDAVENDILPSDSQLEEEYRQHNDSSLQSIWIENLSSQPSTEKLQSATPITRKATQVSSTEEFEDSAQYEVDVIARGWALKLSRLPPDQRLFADKFINDILFEAEMGTLTRTRVLSPTPYLSSLSHDPLKKEP